MAWKYKMNMPNPANPDENVKDIMKQLLGIAGLLLVPAFLQAQVFMRSFENAASLAMGGANVAYPGTGIGLSNEALPAMGNKAGVYLGSAIPYSIPGWQTAQFQGFMKLGNEDGIGLDIHHSGVELYQEQQIRLMYGRRLGERLFVGGSAAWMRVSAQEYGSANGVTFGIGILARVLPSLWLGARIHNPFQQKVGDYTAASLMRLGAAWQASGIFTMLAEVEKSIDRKAQVKAGVEYRPGDVLVLRAGVRTGSVARMSFGLGVRLKNGLALDAGSEWHPSLGITPAAMLVWRK